jgi:sulfite reductase (NADPH) hemoprotein beta-component
LKFDAEVDFHGHRGKEVSFLPTVHMDEKPLSKNELLKAASPTLAGTIAETLADTEAEKFSEDDSQLLKFHGMYQQDDRDKRRVKREYSVMVRTRQTGGTVPAAQYLVYDALADRFGNGTLRITTRQTFQFHGVLKGDLRNVIHTINAALGTTIATAGDINRNVTAPPAPAGTQAGKQVRDDAFDVTRALIPTATAYHQIWIDGAKLEPELTSLVAGAQQSGVTTPYPIPTAAPGADGTAVDPLYGKTYLPRKFKIGFAIPPRNETDIYTNDLGFIAIVENGVVAGYNVVAGGGLGTTHGMAATYPRLASPIGFIPREHVVEVARAAITTHRDFGDRANRRHARLKYILDDRGVPWFIAEMEKRLGFQFAPSRPAVFTGQGDDYGWHKQCDGRQFLALFVEAGRVRDTPGRAFKTALREVVSKFSPQVWLTPSQNILLSDIASEARQDVEAVFIAHGVDVNVRVTPTRGVALACPALPTCGFALAESERALPQVIGEIETLLAELGLGSEEILVRMTGCSNGCARPYAAELGLVGTAPGKYNLLLGGGHAGTRLNKLYRENLKLDDLATELRPLLARFKTERENGERFGDFAARVLVQ